MQFCGMLLVFALPLKKVVFVSMILPSFTHKMEIIKKIRLYR